MARQSQPPVPDVSPEAMSRVAVQAFSNIARLWQLDIDAQLILLGNPSRSAWFKWKKQPETAQLGRDTLERISYILGIYKALQILLPEEQAADAWIKRPNLAPPFGGRSALDRMLSGNVADLYVVRQYLDAARGGWA
jgi:hypothetical protein